MTDTTSHGSDFSRRSLLAALGVTSAAAVVGLDTRPASAATAGFPDAAPTPSGPVPPVAGLHVAFGEDAASTASVTWHSIVKVNNPRVLVAKDGGDYEKTATAVVDSYTDDKSGTVVYAYHARLQGLKADTAYVYLAAHDGAAPEFGTFRTGPQGRQPFRFTSFGDQGTPTLGKKNDAGTFVNDNLGSPAAGDTTAGVESLAPLLHLFNGDLCYANLSADRVRTWSDFWSNNSRSARHRAWMPSPGNHENELGNGPIGYRAYQTYFDLPRQAGQTDVTEGLWYALTVGSVRFVFLANDDVALQDGGDHRVLGYSQGAHKAWLEKTLKAARADKDIDWIVVCMHQVAISSADFNGADLGIRKEWLPLFDTYGVDLVVCGHEHHYERSKAVRGHADNETLTPTPRVDKLDVVDTTQGTVHMIIGGGGTSSPSNQVLYDPPRGKIITAVSDRPAGGGKGTATYVMEDATWAGVRDAANSYGFAAFDVDPGKPGGKTTITVTYYEVSGPYGSLKPFETFKLERPRG